MKNVISQDLYEKKIDLKSQNVFGGSGSSCVFNSYSGSGQHIDTTSEVYDDNDNLISRCTVNFK